MSEVDINYKNSKIAGMDESGTKTLLTEGKYCEDDIEVVYTRPGVPPAYYKIGSTAKTGTLKSNSIIFDDIEAEPVYVFLRISATSSPSAPTSGYNFYIIAAAGPYTAIRPVSLRIASSGKGSAFCTSNALTPTYDAEEKTLKLKGTGLAASPGVFLGVQYVLFYAYRP